MAHERMSYFLRFSTGDPLDVDSALWRTQFVSVLYHVYLFPYSTATMWFMILIFIYFSPLACVVQ